MDRMVTFVGLVAATLWALPGTATAGGFCQSPGSATEGTGTTVTMAKGCYGPTVLRAEEGQTVAFVNRDPEPHTVTAAGGAWGDAHREVATNEVMLVRFDEPGVYAYTCLLHPGMTGAVVIGDGVGVGSGAKLIDLRPLSTLRPPPSPPRGVPTSASAIIAAAAGSALVAYVLGRGRRRRPAPTQE